MNPFLIGAVILAFVSGGYFLDKTGEAAQDISTAAVKTALVLGALYFLLKKYKVIS